MSSTVITHITQINKLYEIIYLHDEEIKKNTEYSTYLKNLKKIYCITRNLHIIPKYDQIKRMLHLHKITEIDKNNFIEIILNDFAISNINKQICCLQKNIEKTDQNIKRINRIKEINISFLKTIK